MIVDLKPGDFFFTSVHLIRVYDGDTVYLDIDFGFHIWRIDRNLSGKDDKGFRLIDIDAPELAPIDTRVAGAAARDYLASLLYDGLGAVPIMVQTFKPARKFATAEDSDDFGRPLIRIWRVSDGLDVNRAVLDSGHAVPYSGGPK